MAKFIAEGLEDWMSSIARVAEIPDDVTDDILDAGAKILEDAEKSSLRAMNLVDSGKLSNSIKTKKKISKDDGHKYRIVAPYGTHHRVNTFSKNKKTNKFETRKKNVGSNEIAFILEFGAPHRNLRATQWMSKAIASCRDKVFQRMSEVFYDWFEGNKM